MNALPRWFIAISAVAALAITAGASSALSTAQTTAAWSDQVWATAEVTIGTWDPTPPGTQGPFTPGESTTVIDEPVWHMPPTNTEGFTFHLTMTSPSATPTPWSVRLDLTQAPFWATPEEAKTLNIWNATDYRVVITPDPTDPTVRILTGAHGWETISADKDVAVHLKTSHVATPPLADPAWFEVTHTVEPDAHDPLDQVWTVTVTPKAAAAEHPFFFGWETVFDFTDQFDAIRDVDHNPSVSWYPDGDYFDVTPGVDPAVNTVTSGSRAAIRYGGDPYEFKVYIYSN